MKKRRALAIFMAIAMVFCYMPTTAVADVAADATEVIVEETVLPGFAPGEAGSSLVDMPAEGFWSTAALQAAVNNGLLNGFTEKDGTYIKPDDPLTRAQMAAIVNRAFGAQEKAALSGNSDVSENGWYYADMQKAVKMGTMKLDTYMRPNDSITRQEAFTILGRALKMKDGVKADLANFGDASQVASWATSGMGAMVKAGYIKGDNNLLTPTANMTRAQFAAIMNNVIKQYITSPGTVTSVVSGNVMVNASGVTLEDVTITGDLIIGDGVGDGTIKLTNVVVKGNLVARGGGVESIIITGGSVNGKVIIAKIDGKIRVFAEDGAEIDVIEIDDGKDDVIIEGTVGTVEVTAADTPIVIKNANVEKIGVKTEGAGNITVDKDSKVDSLVVGASSNGTKVNVAGTVTDFETSAQGTELSGIGTVTNAKVNIGANGTKITTPKTTIKNDDASGVTGSGGKVILPNSIFINDDLVDLPDGVLPAAGGGGSGGTAGGGNVPPTVVSDVINIATITGVVAPVRGAIPIKIITETNQYTGKVVWTPAAGRFAPATVYTATITLTAKTGYTLTGVKANLFKVTGATATNVVDSGLVTAVFPRTEALEADDDGFIFNEHTGVIEGYKGDKTKLEIPGTLKEKTVIGIGEGVFSNNEILTSVKIPETVEFIGTKAFCHCSNLETINIPEAVGKMGNGVFAECLSLTSVDISSVKLSIIPELTFIGCEKLTSINFPDNIVQIDKLAFGDKCGITMITLGDGVKVDENLFVDVDKRNSFNEFYNGKGGTYVYNEEKGIWEVSLGEGNLGLEIDEKGYITGYTGSEKDLKIPNELLFKDKLKKVIGVSQGAFVDNKTLVSISIPDTVRVIVEKAFVDCTITSITLGEKVEVAEALFGNGSRDSFAKFYAKNEHAKGTYYYEGDEWKFREFK